MSKKITTLSLLLSLVLCGGAFALPITEITISNNDFTDMLRFLCQWHVNGYYCVLSPNPYPGQCAADCNLGHQTCMNQPTYLPNPQTPAERQATCATNLDSCMDFCGVSRLSGI